MKINQGLALEELFIRHKWYWILPWLSIFLEERSFCVAGDRGRLSGGEKIDAEETSKHKKIWDLVDTLTTSKSCLKQV